MPNNTSYAMLHCHSEHSLSDSPLKIKDMVAKAKEMEVQAIALTDHGTCTGIIEFINACKNAGIKPVLGVEAYLQTEYVKRGHLILLAKNYEGYIEISRALSDANRNQEAVGGIFMPIMTKKDLTRNFGHGNVIATSACISGILAGIFQHGKKKEQEIIKIRKKQKKYKKFSETDVREEKEQYQKLSETLESMHQKKEELQNLANKKYVRRISGLKSMQALICDTNGLAEYEKAKQNLELEMQETEDAKEALLQLSEDLKKCQSEKRKLEKNIKKIDENRQNYEKLEAKIQELEQDGVSEDILYGYAEQEALWMQELFGEDFYIELQNHGMETEAWVMPLLADIAIKHKIPVIGANDSHIAEKNHADTRAYLRALRMKRWQEIEHSEAECYMKSDKELETALGEILEGQIVSQAMENIRKVADLCNAEIPEDTHYPKYRDENGVPVPDAPGLLRQKSYQAIPVCYPDGFQAYDRLEYELDTIISLGYADYLLIVADFIAYGREYGLRHPSGVAYSVGPGRGSGAGCVVNYLLGITRIDPLKYGLKFERFLNKARVSMPDIDTDFSDEVREAVIAYVTEKYRQSADDEYVALIRTKLTQGARAAVENGARVWGFEKYPIPEEKEGSIQKLEKERIEKQRHEIQELGARIRKQIPKDAGVELEDCMEEIERKFPGIDTQETLKRAKGLQNIMVGVSVHGAGIIISDGKPLKEYVPLLYNKKKGVWEVQCDMNEAEHDLKLLKMDFLALRNLDVITECIRRIHKNTGITIDPDHLPFETEVFTEIFGRGRTECVFQFESGGMKKMLRNFNPQNIEDVILLVALYRPGPMDFIPDILDVKNGRKHPEYLIPQLEKILAPTYGKPIYQEQLMDIFHECAGFSLEEADIIRRYMSKKKTESFLSYKPQFIRGMVKNGAEETKAEAFWDSLVNFSKYAFNKSHAAVYAIVAYITAWLKYHYKMEYMCAVLNHTDTKKLPAMLYECKELGIQVLPPDINQSEAVCEDHMDYIRYGLGTIKGLGEQGKVIIQERKEHGIYESFADFISRAHQNSGQTEKLIMSGAFDSFCPRQRLGLVKTITKYKKPLKVIKDKEKKILELEQELLQPEADRAAIRKKIKTAEEARNYAQRELYQIRVSGETADDPVVTLPIEKELLGAYISSHPLENYAFLYQNGSVCLINDFQEGNGWYAGIITDLKIIDKHGEMAFFRMEDMTGTVEVSCFKEQYQKYKDLIQENQIIKIYGKAVLESSDQDEEEPEKKLNLQLAFPCHLKKKSIFISFPDNTVYSKIIAELIERYQDEHGHPVVLHDQSNGNIFEKEIKVEEEFLDLEIPGVSIWYLGF